MKKTDVCLVAVPAGDFREVGPFPGLASISAVLEQEGINVEIIQYYSSTNRNLSKRILDRIQQLSPAVVGLSVLSDNYKRVKYITEELKKKNGPYVVWGGNLPSMAHELVLDDTPIIDYVVRGYGEHSFPELVKSLLKDKDPRNVRGLAYLKGSKPVANPPSYVDFTKLPWADMPYRAKQIIKANRILKNGWLSLPIEVERGGCLGNCSFCNSPDFAKEFQEKDRKKQFRGVQDVFDEIMFWKTRGFDAFNLGSDDNGSNPEFLDQLVNMVEKEKKQIIFQIDARANEVLQNKELFERIYSSKYFTPSLGIGLEAMTQRQLNLIGKGLTVEQNKEVVKFMRKLLKRGKYSAVRYFLIYFTHPEMSYRDLLENNKFMKEFANRDRFAGERISVDLRTVGYPKTRFWRYLVERGYRPDRKRGFAIYDYEFLDPDVRRIYPQFKERFEKYNRIARK